ncbi:MAG: DNA methyltransferase [Patescibacteria group bacterium]|nr:DNA methyltransferase [Patescibacteria group bacterium]
MDKKYLNTIIKGDCIETLKKLPENSVDLIFADPPYNLQLKGDLYRPNQTKVSAVNDKWDKFPSFDDYDKFTYSWLLECKRVLKKDGSIWVIGSYHNIFRVGKIMQDIGFWILNDIIWIKTNPMPNFKGTRFNNAQETLILASKSDKSKSTFHYRSMKAFNDDKQMRSDWYIPICSGGERIKVNGNKAHSTQKPEALLYRIILSTSNIGDIILDPFMGSGTTGAVAKKMRRNFIGIEKENFYIKVANDRIKKVKLIDEKLLLYPIESRNPKVPFGNLVESGLINVGENLYLKNGDKKAVVLADSTLSSNEEIGSIHKVSARLLNKETNNGWTFWYIKRRGQLVLINDLRQDYINTYLKI